MPPLLRSPRPLAQPDADGYDDTATPLRTRGQREQGRTVIAVGGGDRLGKISDSAQQPTVDVKLIRTIERKGSRDGQSFAGRRGGGEVQAVPGVSIVVRVSPRLPTWHVSGQPDIVVPGTGRWSELDPLPTGVVEPRIRPPGIIADMKLPGPIERNRAATDRDRDYRAHGGRDYGCGVCAEQDRRRQQAQDYTCSVLHMVRLA